MSSPITEVKPSQVAQLMKENANLKEEVKSTKSLCDHFEMLNKKNYEEKEKLTEENEKLKEDIKKLRMWYNEREEDTKERLMMRKCQVKDLKEEKEKLKEEIEYVDKYINIITSTLEVGMLEDINDKIKEIKEENEKLKFSTRANNIEAVYSGSDLIDMKEFNDHLKNRHPDIYQKLYDYFDMDEHLEEEE